MSKSISAWLELIRPPLLILGFLASVSLLAWTDHLFSWGGLCIVLVIGLTNASFDLWNEIKDAPVDEVNKPHKPIPRGDIDPTKALIASNILFICACSIILPLFLLTLNFFFIIVGIAGLFAGFVYNYLGRRDLGGQIALGTTYGCGAFVASYLNKPLFSVAFALFCVSFNMLVALQDIDAESLRSSPPLVCKLKGKTRILSGVLTTCSLFLLFNCHMYPWPKLAFYLTFVMPFIVAVFYSKRTAEYGCRIFGRVYLILAFFLLLLTSVF